MIHGFAVALSPGVAVANSALRVAGRELHINPWLVGTKAIGSMNLGDSTVTSALGLVMVAARSAPVALANAPTELIIGDTSAAFLINLADEFVISTAAVQSSGFVIA